MHKPEGRDKERARGLAIERQTSGHGSGREPHTSPWPNIGLNEVGTRMWNLLHQYSALQKVFEIMQDEYEVAPESLEQDLLHLVDQLCAQGLVRVSRP
jgi:hypothetical protein